MVNQWLRNTYSDNKKLTVVNFFGGPGCGKSTTAASLFAKMKKQGYKVEFVHEVAKDYVWERWSHIFGEQDYIFAQQHRLIRRLTLHDIDYAIVDSSILLSLFYMPSDFPKSFAGFVREVFDSYDNINIFLTRNPAIQYVQAGRNENEDEAQEKDRAIKQYFDDNQIHYWEVLSGDSAAGTSLRIIESHSKTTRLD